MEDEGEEKREEMIEEIKPRAHTCELHERSDDELDGPPESKKKQVGVERNLVKNGGVKKMVVKPSTCSSPETPLYRDEVTVHYTGTLPDGTLFDTSRNKEPFTLDWD